MDILYKNLFKLIADSSESSDHSSQQQQSEPKGKSKFANFVSKMIKSTINFPDNMLDLSPTTRDVTYYREIIVFKKQF